MDMDNGPWDDPSPLQTGEVRTLGNAPNVVFTSSFAHVSHHLGDLPVVFASLSHSGVMRKRPQHTSAYLRGFAMKRVDVGIPKQVQAPGEAGARPLRATSLRCQPPSASSPRSEASCPPPPERPD